MSKLPDRPTYQDSLEACRRNVEKCVARARAARLKPDGPDEYEYQRAQAEAASWRRHAERYRRDIAARPELAGQPIRLATFDAEGRLVAETPPEAPSVRQAASSPPPKGETAETTRSPHHAHPGAFSEREPGEDDDGDGSSIPF